MSYFFTSFPKAKAIRQESRYQNIRSTNKFSGDKTALAGATIELPTDQKISGIPTANPASIDLPNKNVKKEVPPIKNKSNKIFPIDGLKNSFQFIS